jgi:hypothetical protein
MEIVTLIIALTALVVALLAYRRTGGMPDLRGQGKSVGSAVDVLRTKTADALNRLENVVRGSGGGPARAVPEESREGRQGRAADRAGPERGG